MDSYREQVLNCLTQVKNNIDKWGYISVEDVKTLIGICALSTTDQEIYHKQLIHALNNYGDYLPEEEVIIYH